MSQQEDTIASEVIAASLGGAISASVLYPLEVLKTKMQAAGSSTSTSTSSSADDNDIDDDDEEEEEETTNKNKTMIQFARDLYQQEGTPVFFRGVETSAFQSATEKALYFFAYQGLKDMHALVTGKSQLDGMSNLILGCLAEWAHLPITLPLDCWTTLIQTSTNKDETPMVLLCQLLAAGPSKMYKGIQAYTVLCLKPALQYTIFEQVKAIVVRGRVQKTLSAAEAFLLGMVARTIATVVVFPYLRAKVMLQAAKSSSSTVVDTDSGKHATREQKTSIPKMLATMYSTGGLALWFQGLGPELTRGVLSAALMMMIKEKISILVKEILLGRATKAAAERKRRVVKY